MFGSKAYVHIPKEKRGALEVKSEKLCFVGYAEGQKAYRFLNSRTCRITISRDAKFMEMSNAKEIICSVPRTEAPATGGVLTVLLVIPSKNHAQEFDGQFEGDSVPGDDLDSSYATPPDGIARVSTRQNKGVTPKILIEESYAAEMIPCDEMKSKSFKEVLSSKRK